MGVTRMAGVAAAFGRDLDFDLDRITTIIGQARRAGVALLVLPDAALGGYLDDLRNPDPAELPPALAPDDPLLHKIAEAAAEMVVCLGYCEAGPDGRRYPRRLPVLEYPTHAELRRVDATTTWTTSVCTGSLLLGAAGLLDGRRATSHWLALEQLTRFGAEPTGERVVFDGKYVTAAGVSAGIDMALRLVARIAGDEVAQGVQLGIEYDPQPPFDAGSPEKAPAAVVDFVDAQLRPMVEGRIPA